MTLEQKKLIACAELDGWTQTKNDLDALKAFDEMMGDGYISDPSTFGMPSYANSLGAIVPVVVKWCGEDTYKWCSFFSHLSNFTKFPVNQVVTSVNKFIAYYKASPSQILDALLLAAGEDAGR